MSDDSFPVSTAPGTHTEAVDQLNRGSTESRECEGWRRGKFERATSARLLQ